MLLKSCQYQKIIMLLLAPILSFIDNDHQLKNLWRSNGRSINL